MEGVNNLNNIEQESDVIRREERMKSAQEVMVDLFGSIGETATERILEKPTFKAFSER